MVHERVHYHDEAANHQMPTAAAFWIIQIVSMGNVKLITKFDADSLLYWLRHFECDNHTVHVLTQQSLPSPLTSTVKLSLLTHVHSSPLCLAARLHQCSTNHSGYINNGWMFSRQTLYNNVFYVKHSKESTKKILELIKVSLHSAVCKVNIKITFLYIKNTKEIVFKNI